MITLAIVGCGRSDKVTVELTPALTARGFSLKSWNTQDATLKLQLTVNAKARLPKPGESWFYSQYDKQGQFFGSEMRLSDLEVSQGTTEWFEFDVPNMNRIGKLILDIHYARFAD